MATVVEAEGLHKEFGAGQSRLVVLAGVDLHIQAGELVAVVGSSGSGKSTLLHILAGLMHPTRGRVTLSGEDLYRLSDGRRAALRNRNLGFVYQMHHLLPEFTALENVMLPAFIAGRSVSDARAAAMKLLESMDVAARAGHKPGELSGGEQQRVAVARALINDPEILLADEPSGNLDQEASRSLHELLRQLSQEKNQTILVATHSPALANLAERRLWLDHGDLKPAASVKEWV